MIVIAAIVLVSAYSIVVLLDFVESLEKFRGRIEWIYKKYFECEEREALGLTMRKGVFNRVRIRCWPCLGFASGCRRRLLTTGPSSQSSQRAKVRARIEKDG